MPRMFALAALADPANGYFGCNDFECDIAPMLDQLIREWARRYPSDVNCRDRYRGRFAPSPTGPLHAGSLVAALASWLDARAHDGEWLVRIDDLDAPRTVPGADQAIVAALKAYGLAWDGALVYQSERQAAYRAAFERLRAAGLVYPCSCTRKEIVDSITSVREPGREAVYPGTCRNGVRSGRAPRAWRVRVDAARIVFTDRARGVKEDDLARTTGDFVLLRADGQWAYQLAVVVDDADAGVTHVVRGADLLDSTPRQLYLADRLGLARPQYLHVPVVANQAGEKLSKQSGAVALDTSSAGITQALDAAARHLFG